MVWPFGSSEYKPPGWLTLTDRWKLERSSVSDGDLKQAVRDLFVEDQPGLEESDYAAHGSARLEYVTDDGPRHVLEVGRGGTAAFRTYDALEDESPAAELRREGLDRESALDLFRLLARGLVEELQAEEGWSRAGGEGEGDEASDEDEPPPPPSDLSDSAPTGCS